MVAKKITCPSRSDDIGNQNTNSYTKRFGFFANESQNSQYFESGRNRSFKGKTESAGEGSKRSNCRRSNRFNATVSIDAHNQLFRGKMSAAIYLKPEPVFESTMFHVSDCEFFQDLAPLCSDLAKEEQVQITDYSKKTEEYPQITDPMHAPFSPQGWDVYCANSPSSIGAFIPTASDQLSPIMDGFTHTDNKFLYSTEVENEHKLPTQDLDWDISKMQVVLGDLAPEEMVDINPHYVAGGIDYHYPDSPINTHNKLILDSDEYDTKFVTVMPSEVENRAVAEPELSGYSKWMKPQVERRRANLKLDVDLLGAIDVGNTLSTPEVLNYVEQLEKADYPLPSSNKPYVQLPPEQDIGTTYNTLPDITPVHVEYQPITPESHLDSDNDDTRSRCSSKRKRKNSEDSDQTYVPDVEYTPRKYKRRKPNMSIKDKIQALEESQETQEPRKRGRPPKRRESTISSVCSADVDDNNSSFSTQEVKYRELRDKNNEASKRSRMNRKLKELQMEQMALELEERNKKLKVRADILEEMTKRLKDALMTAMLTK